MKMGMLFSRRRNKNFEGVTTTENLLIKEKKVENVKTQKGESVPTKKQQEVVVGEKTTQQPKFKI
jgi:hypothetical protein